MALIGQFLSRCLHGQDKKLDINELRVAGQSSASRAYSIVPSVSCEAIKYRGNRVQSGRFTLLSRTAPKQTRVPHKAVTPQKHTCTRNACYVKYVTKEHLHRTSICRPSTWSAPRPPRLRRRRANQHGGTVVLRPKNRPPSQAHPVLVQSQDLAWRDRLRRLVETHRHHKTRRGAIHLPTAAASLAILETNANGVSISVSVATRPCTNKFHGAREQVLPVATAIPAPKLPARRFASHSWTLSYSWTFYPSRCLLDLVVAPVS